MVHSDRGCQFRYTAFAMILRAPGIHWSLGRVASAVDNAVIASVFTLPRNSFLKRRRWTTRDEFRLAIVTWIKRHYHRRRRQAALNKLTPIEIETIHNAALAARQKKPQGLGAIPFKITWFSFAGQTS